MYKFIDKAIVSGNSTNSVTFSNIPQTHKTLVLYATVLQDASGVTTNPLTIRINGRNNLNIYQSYIRSVNAGSPTATSNSSVATHGFFASGNESNLVNPGVGVFHFFDYTQATHRHVFNYGGVGPHNTVSGGIGQLGYWDNTTDPITSIVIDGTGGSNFHAGSSFYLYGIS